MGWGSQSVIESNESQSWIYLEHCGIKGIVLKMKKQGNNHLGNCIIPRFRCCFCCCICSEIVGCLKQYGIAEITPSRPGDFFFFYYSLELIMLKLKQCLSFLVNNKPREALSLRWYSQLCLHSSDSHGGDSRKDVELSV